MSDRSTAARLSGEEILALRFASYRQLARWGNTPTPSPDQRAKRDALKRAVAVLNEQAYTHGCQLQPVTTENDTDA